ncbi:MAG TPA: tRNA dihydrouridine synthase DusB [Nitrospirota bacterium]|nr:tRNA dihydrouridine synthase DusB [Nitrospirota bacterium]
MDIGALLSANPLVLAPMAGITDLPFRLICRELGAGLVFSEMVSAEALIRSHTRTHTMLRSSPAERPVVFQIFGSKPSSMAEAARVISQGDIDYLDINMGCPVPKVVKSGSGSALLRDLGLAREIMSAVIAASRVPVLVKIRLGWDAKSIIAVDMARAAEAAGIAAITVHGRTKAQGFSGAADWSVIKDVRNAVAIPVIGNGDVRTASDARRLLEETGCNGVMIGRAVQGNPWVFREALHFLNTGVLLSPPTPHERQATMLRHVRDMVLFAGEHAGIQEIRKHLCWYSKGLQHGAEFRTRVNRLSTLREVEREIGFFFATSANEAVRS